MTQRITSPQQKQIERLMSDALGNTNSDKDGAQRLIEQGDKFMAYVMAGIRRFTAKASDHSLAREIMGKSFLGIPEVEQHFGELTDEQRQALAVIPFSEEMLKACAETHILVADVGISLLNIRSKARKDLFYKQDWYESQEFAGRTETACWRLIRKTPVNGSFSKDWSEQQALINKINEVPSARQVVYLTILHFLVTGERLFEKVYVRTCVVDSHGNRVLVGRFDGDGLLVGIWGVHVRFDVLGVASARKVL